MAVFLSTTINRVDRKGRVSVPAAFRAVLSAQPFQGIVVFRSFKLPALEGAGMDRMATLSDSVNALDAFSDDQDDLAAAIFADACPLPFDGDGRVIIPPDMLEFAGIAEQCAFVGRGRTFQIWEPDAFRAHQTAARERVRSRGTTLAMGGSGGDARAAVTPEEAGP